MISAILIDDELHCVAALQHDLKMFCPDVQVVDACHSAKEGILSIRKHQPQLVFLDVEMPWMNGFEMLEILGDSTGFQTIFTTAYSEFAARAFRVSAVDYLLKPIDGNDLMTAVAKAAKGVVNGKQNLNITNLLNNARQAADQQKIAVHTREGYDFVPVNEIIYCKAEGAYTYIMLPGKKMVVSKPLGEMEQSLPEQLFERIHHSLLVNLQHINSLRKSEGLTLIMDNGEELPVSRARKDKLMERMGIK